MITIRQKYKYYLLRLYFTLVKCLQTEFAFAVKGKINDRQHLLTIPALSAMGSHFLFILAERHSEIILFRSNPK